MAMLRDFLGIAAIVISWASAWYVGLSGGWNSAETSRFEMEVEAQGWSTEPDLLPRWPAAIGLAAVLLCLAGALS